MFISRTPLRISFFGGGTDHPEFFLKHGGAVLGTSIDKYIYHTISKFEGNLFDYSIKIVYSKIECVKSLEEIKHYPYQAILRFMNLRNNIELHVLADLPAFSGLGSSSSFSVGLLKVLHSYKNSSLSKNQLALDAIKLEREVMNEAVGFQDQTFASYGGLNLIQFRKDGSINVEKIAVTPNRKEELQKCLLLYFTGITRKAQNIERKKISNIRQIEERLIKIKAQVEPGLDILTGNAPLSHFGELLHANWVEKRCLDEEVSNKVVDTIYERALQSGALGGKLLGGGGGGFILFFVPPEKQSRVRLELKDLNEIDFTIDTAGSTIVYPKNSSEKKD